MNQQDNNSQNNRITVFLTATLYSDELMEALTGETVQNKEDAILEGYDLVIQKLDQIPPFARRVVENSGWGNDFESYNLAPGNGHIKGIKCSVTVNQWERLKDWDLAPDWYTEKDVEITNVETGQREQVRSIVMGEGQEFDRKVDGENFDPFLMPREKVLEAATRVRQLYNERHGINSEGNPRSGKES